MHAEPDLIAIQHTTVRHDTIGFMQVREYDVELPAALSLLNGIVQQLRPARDLGELSRGFLHVS